MAVSTTGLNNMSADSEPIEQEPILEMTGNARDKVLRVRAQETDPERLALWVEISGIEGMNFTHNLRIAPLEEAGDDHVIQHHDDLPLVVPAANVDDLRGATITIDGDPTYGAVTVVNPNRPESPAVRGGMAGAVGDLSGDLAQRVSQVLDSVVNPSIAQHGGRAELVGVEEDTAYLRLSGGCQGCGMAKVTLSQGIEQAISENIPEIVNIVDVTDHAAGENPYFESSKK